MDVVKKELLKNLQISTGAKIVRLAPEVMSRPGVIDYFSLIDYNVKTIHEALSPES